MPSEIEDFMKELNYYNNRSGEQTMGLYYYQKRYYYVQENAAARRCHQILAPKHSTPKRSRSINGNQEQ